MTTEPPEKVQPPSVQQTVRRHGRPIGPEVSDLMNKALAEAHEISERARRKRSPQMTPQATQLLLAMARRHVPAFDTLPARPTILAARQDAFWEGFKQGQAIAQNAHPLAPSNAARD
jgi:hypothetical protein